MPTYKMLAKSVSINQNRVEFRCGGTFLGQVKAMENKFSKLSIIGATGRIPSKPESHSSVVNGYGNWWQVSKCETVDGSYTTIKAYDRTVSNSRRAGTTERDVYERFDSINLFEHVLANKAMYFEADLQQYYNDSYTSDNYVPGWVTDKTRYFMDLDYIVKQPTVTNFNISHNGYIDNDVVVTWVSDLQDTFSVVVNGYEFAEGQGTTAKRIVIPKNRLKIGDNAIYIKVRNIIPSNVEGVGGASAETITNTQTIKLNTLMPTLSNITISNTGWLVENNTVIRWQSTNQLSCKVYVDDKLIVTGATGKEATLPGGSCKVGSNRIKVEIIKNAIPGVADSERKVFQEIVKDYTRVTPVIDTITVTGKNRDYPSTITWAGSSYDEALLFLNDVQVGLPFPVDRSSYTTLQGELFEGQNKIKVIAIKRTSFDTITAAKEIEVNIIQDNPIIYSLEPSGIEVNSEIPQTISFNTNTFCDSWSLTINGSNRHTGTTERSIVVPQNAFRIGNNTLTLESFYRPSWSNTDNRKTTLTVDFVAYGKPQTPTITNTDVFQTATPLITWSCGTGNNNVQYEYDLRIMDGSTVHETSKAASYTNSYRLKKALLNNKTYTIHVSIKNRYGIWSNFATKTFNTSFNSITKPWLEVTTNGVVNFILLSSELFSGIRDLSLYRNEGQGWVEIGYKFLKGERLTDYTAKINSEVSYKCRVYDTSGGYADSDVVKVFPQAINYHLTSLNGDSYQLDFVKLQEKRNNSKVIKQFAGQSKPTVFGGSVNYKTYSLSVTIFNDEVAAFENFIDRIKGCCFREYRGIKVYCELTVESANFEKGYKTYVLSLTETEMNEVRFYKGSAN